LWDVFGDRLGAKLAQVYGGYVWAEFVLLAAVLALLVKHRPPAQPARSASEDAFPPSLALRAGKAA
jgi:hypothetical protein